MMMMDYWVHLITALDVWADAYALSRTFLFRYGGGPDLVLT